MPPPWACTGRPGPRPCSSTPARRRRRSPSSPDPARRILRARHVGVRALFPGRDVDWCCPFGQFEEVLRMVTKVFTSGRIRKADYDPVSRQLDLHWENKSVLAYKHVPDEVFRRLCSAPNPATYWEDRISEEYPKGTPRSSGKKGGPDLHDLFGEPPAPDEPPN